MGAEINCMCSGIFSQAASRPFTKPCEEFPVDMGQNTAVRSRQQI